MNGQNPFLRNNLFLGASSERLKDVVRALRLGNLFLRLSVHKTINHLETISTEKVFRSARRPTELDKKLLLWTGRFKKEEDIPPFLSLQTLRKARNLVRIQICYVMIALTVLGCIAMVISGKRAAERKDTLEKINVEKKAQWKLERETEQGLEPAAAKAE
uniref:Uncharacterized protein n=1 Tax=Varanus komodoensis TaxID=61221 RepID=A0A8D2L1I0_VARKO